MKYIKDLREGDRVSDIYLVKQKSSATTKNGKMYENVIIQDKTGTLDAKIWEPNSPGICDFDAMDYVDFYGDVTTFNNQLQLNVKRTRYAQPGEYNAGDYLPVSSRDVDEMWKEVLSFIESVENKYLKALLQSIFVEDEAFQKAFKFSSAAKSVHHGFIGGLLEHSVSVTELCDFYCKRYKKLNRDLLITAALCHDIGKIKELSAFPMNDYTDEGNFLGHIVMGSEMISEQCRKIEGFPKRLELELKHCIISHHGELEFGSPKKPVLIEAVALNFADNTDAKMETFTEILNGTAETGWLGFNRLFDANITSTHME